MYRGVWLSLFCYGAGVLAASPDLLSDLPLPLQCIEGQLVAQINNPDQFPNNLNKVFKPAVLNFLTRCDYNAFDLAESILDIDKNGPLKGENVDPKDSSAHFLVQSLLERQLGFSDRVSEAVEGLKNEIEPKDANRLVGQGKLQPDFETWTMNELLVQLCNKADLKACETEDNTTSPFREFVQMELIKRLAKLLVLGTSTENKDKFIGNEETLHLYRLILPSLSTKDPLNKNIITIPIISRMAAHLEPLMTKITQFNRDGDLNAFFQLVYNSRDHGMFILLEKWKQLVDRKLKDQVKDIWKKEACKDPSNQQEEYRCYQSLSYLNPKPDKEHLTMALDVLGELASSLDEGKPGPSPFISVPSLYKEILQYKELLDAKELIEKFPTDRLPELPKQSFYDWYFSYGVSDLVDGDKPSQKAEDLLNSSNEKIASTVQRVLLMYLDEQVSEKSLDDEGLQTLLLNLIRKGFIQEKSYAYLAERKQFMMRIMNVVTRKVYKVESKKLWEQILEMGGLFKSEALARQFYFEIFRNPTTDPKIRLTIFKELLLGIPENLPQELYPMDWICSIPRKCAAVDILDKYPEQVLTVIQELAPIHATYWEDVLARMIAEYFAMAEIKAATNGGSLDHRKWVSENFYPGLSKDFKFAKMACKVASSLHKYWQGIGSIDFVKPCSQFMQSQSTAINTNKQAMEKVTDLDDLWTKTIELVYNDDTFMEVWLNVPQDLINRLDGVPRSGAWWRNISQRVKKVFETRRDKWKEAKKLFEPELGSLVPQKDVDTNAEILKVIKVKVEASPSDDSLKEAEKAALEYHDIVLRMDKLLELENQPLETAPWFAFTLLSLEYNKLGQRPINDLSYIDTPDNVDARFIKIGKIFAVPLANPLIGETVGDQEPPWGVGIWSLRNLIHKHFYKIDVKTKKPYIDTIEAKDKENIGAIKNALALRELDNMMATQPSNQSLAKKIADLLKRTNQALKRHWDYALAAPDYETYRQNNIWAQFVDENSWKRLILMVDLEPLEVLLNKTLLGSGSTETIHLCAYLGKAENPVTVKGKGQNNFMHNLRLLAALPDPSVCVETIYNVFKKAGEAYGLVKLADNSSKSDLDSFSIFKDFTTVSPFPGGNKMAAIDLWSDDTKTIAKAAFFEYLYDGYANQTENGELESSLEPERLEGLRRLLSYNLDGALVANRPSSLPSQFAEKVGKYIPYLIEHYEDESHRSLVQRSRALGNLETGILKRLLEGPGKLANRLSLLFARDELQTIIARLPLDRKYADESALNRYRAVMEAIFSIWAPKKLIGKARQLYPGVFPNEDILAEEPSGHDVGSSLSGVPPPPPQLEGMPPPPPPQGAPPPVEGMPPPPPPPPPL